MIPPEYQLQGEFFRRLAKRIKEDMNKEQIRYSLWRVNEGEKMKGMERMMTISIQ